MLRRLILLTFLLLSLLSCGSAQKSDVKVSLGFAVVGDVVNKAMLSGFNKETRERFARKIQSESFEFELSNGNWELYLTYWEDADYLGTDTSCKNMQVSLNGEPVDLMFDINSESCKNYSDYFDTSTPSFYQTQLIACNSTPTLDGSVDGTECDGDKDTSILSYKIKLMEFQQAAESEFIRFGTGLEVCIDANSNGGDAKTVQKSAGMLSNFIPVIDSKESPFIVHLNTYSSVGCEGDLGKFEFNNGLQHSPQIKSHDSVWASSATNKKNYLYLMSGLVVIPSLDPNTISGLIMWLDGADNSTMFTNTDCVNNPVIANGSYVKCWRDKSVQGDPHHAIEATDKPMWETNVLNGLGGLRFNDKVLNVTDHADLDQGSAITVFMVFREFSKDFTTRKLLYKGSGNRTLDLYLGSSNNIINFTDDGSSSKASYLTPTAVGSPKIVALETILGAGQTMILDGADDVTSLDFGGSPSSSGTVVDTAQDLKIGNYFVGSNSHLNGHILEILYFNQQLSAQEKLDIDSYLKAKWNL